MIEYIPTPEINNKLDKHLTVLGNLRTIISGKFGSGKTTFLKHYFEDHEEYECVKVIPVNYSIADNRDVFELIKYDVLFQLISKVELSDTEEPLIKRFGEYVGNNKTEAVKIFTPLIKVIPLIGNALSSLTERYIDFIKKLTDHLEEDKSQKGFVEDYFSELAITKGGIYEEDPITELIRELISKLQKESGKKVVFVVDDLDRIDPEHIFRILNVFSAHHDIHQDDTNKFDFDKVIVVCDIENIRNIFQHKYGGKTDFNGYIDKFYSKQIFEFGSSEYVGRIVESIFRNLKGEYLHLSLHENSTVVQYVIGLLLSLTNLNLITFRNIIRFNNLDYILPLYKIDVGDRSINNFNLFLIPIFNFLKDIIGDNDKLEMILKENSNYFERVRVEKDWILLILILPVLFQDHSKILGGDGTTLNGQLDKLSFRYSFSQNTSPLVITSNDLPSAIESLNMNKLLYEAFVFARSKNQLR